MTLTLHNSQVYCSGSCSGELAVHSGQLLSVAKLGSEFFWCWSLLRNTRRNNKAADLQRFDSSYYSRRLLHVVFEHWCHA